tara:strand:+ start:33862 stop:35145 length:1284 start_codon:yes stop_codon:yes gene_type:complete
MTLKPHLIDDCFLHDKDRLRHDDVISLLLSRLNVIVGTQEVALNAALERHLADTITAPRNVPLHDNSAVDGYAFAHGEYLQRPALVINQRIAAGDAIPGNLPSGTAARIFTGAMMPPNADTVAMQEDCVLSQDGLSVEIPAGLRAGANRRRAGEDLQTGDVLFSAGQLLRPQDVAALASVGVAKVPVFQNLRVALVSTGNEIVRPDAADALSMGQVFDSNHYMLAALCQNLPVELVDLGVLEDKADVIEHRLSKAAKEYDIILTTGGASRGEEDHIVRTIDRLGTRHLWQIAIKPGRPMSFGQIEDCVFLGLPGNPVAAFICFLLYCHPAIRMLAGGTYREPRRYPIIAGFQIEAKKADRREFLRGWLERDDDGQMVARKFDRDGSGLISGLRQADGLIELPEETRTVRPGDTISYIPFSEFGIYAG